MPHTTYSSHTHPLVGATFGWPKWYSYCCPHVTGGRGAMHGATTGRCNLGEIAPYCGPVHHVECGK